MRGEGFIGVLGILVCAPIAYFIIKKLVIDIIVSTYKDSYKGTTRDKAKAVLKSIINGLIMISILTLVALCSYNPDPEHHERYDEYQQRLEPKW